MSGPLIGAVVGDQAIGGPSGPGTVIGVNILPGQTSSTGTLATVGLLTGDGTVAEIALPTTPQAVQQGLAPVGALTGVLLGDQVGGTVTQLTNGLSPVVATVTSVVDQAATPLLGTVNGVLAPVLSPLVGGNGALAPVTNLVEGTVGALTGPLGGGTPPESSITGPLVSTNIGGNVLGGASSTNSVIGVNLLPSTAPSAQGQLLTADVLTSGKIVDVAVPTTAAGVEAGLKPVGNLVGTLLGPQAGGAVDQLSTTVAPIAATATAAVDSLLSPVLDTVNGLAPTLPGGSGGGAASPLAPVTGVVGGLLGSATGGSGAPTAPLTGVIGSVLNPQGSTGGLLAPVTGVIGGVLAPTAPTGGGSPAAPVTGLLGGLLGR
ncbi:hypothetical protein [Sphingobium sp. ZW T5_29]|uniref:hypothetical protein n=1 Tax=Sphingobium sp. ZW T5_29 TaxID=3378077 RepID=UPI0038531AFD